jgi:hypothetical protein
LKREHAKQEPPRENDGIMGLPSRDKFVEAIECLKDNKAAISESIAANLLKHGAPNLMNTLNEIIGETLSESCTEGVLSPVYKKGDKLYCKNYRGTVAKVLHSRLLPCVVQHL